MHTHHLMFAAWRNCLTLARTAGFLARAASAAIAGLVLCLRLTATTVIPPDFPELVNESDYIVRVLVKSTATELRLMPTGKRLPYTRVELEVKEIIAGKPPSPLILEILGGMSGGRELAVTGAPKFVAGEESILFVQGNGRQIFPLVRMAHGHYPIAKDTVSGREYMVRSDGAPLSDLREVSQPIHLAGGKTIAETKPTGAAPARALTPAEFARQVRRTATQPHLLEK
jgi:hypothetical protein